MRHLRLSFVTLVLIGCVTSMHASVTPYPVGITDSGTVVLTAPYGVCTSDTAPCYYVTHPFNTIPDYLAEGLPALPYDSGASCAGLPAGADPANSLCNNGYYVFEVPGVLNGGRIFDGYGAYNYNPDPRFSAASIDALVLNSHGQFAFASGADEQDYFGTVLTPEPATFALLGTGLLTALGVARRRLF